MNGSVEVTLNITGDYNVQHTITYADVFVSDGRYHIIRFVIDAYKGALYVDNVERFKNHLCEFFVLLSLFIS